MAATADTERTRAELSDEDAQRLRRLSEEVRGRLLEVALIVTRNLGLPMRPNSLVSFVPRETDPTEDAGAGDWMEIGEVDGVEYCYGSIGGHSFAESPCGGGVIEV